MKAVEAEINDEWEPKDHGFEFSKAEVEMRAIHLKPGLFARAHRRLGPLCAAKDDARNAKYPEELAA